MFTAKINVPPIACNVQPRPHILYAHVQSMHLLAVGSRRCIHTWCDICCALIGTLHFDAVSSNLVMAQFPDEIVRAITDGISDWLRMCGIGAEGLEAKKVLSGRQGCFTVIHHANVIARGMTCVPRKI